MIPPGSHPLWAKLVKGEKKHEFIQVSASMLFSALQRDYKREPAKLSDQVAQARKFFEKYEKIMAADIRTLFG